MSFGAEVVEIVKKMKIIEYVIDFTVSNISMTKED